MTLTTVPKLVPVRVTYVPPAVEPNAGLMAVITDVFE